MEEILSGIAQKWAWIQPLPIIEKLVLIVLAYHADKDGLAWAKSKRMQGETGLSRSGFKVQIRKLEKRGLIVRMSHYSEISGRQTTNRYQLPLGGGHVLEPLPGHTREPLPGHESGTPSGSLTGDPLDIQYDIQNEIQSIGDESPGDLMNIEDVLNQHVALTREDIFRNALRKNDKLTADGCGYLWRHCRASAGDNGFQVETLRKEKILLHSSYKRVGEDFNLAVWAVMTDWIGFTKEAEDAQGAFSLPLYPTVVFFIKYIETAVEFATSNSFSDDSDFVQVIAKAPKPLTKPKENKDNAHIAITSEELAAINRELEE